MTQRTDDDERIERTRALYREGQCCAQAIVGGFLGETPQSPLLRSLAAGLCGGMGGRKGDCGALTGAALCLGPLVQAPGRDQDARVRALAAELNRRFAADYAGTRCEQVLAGKSLLSRRRGYCEAVTVHAAELLSELLARED